MTDFTTTLLALKAKLGRVSVWRRTGLLKGLNQTEEQVLAYYLDSLLMCSTHPEFALDPTSEKTKKLVSWMFVLQRRIFPRHLRINTNGQFAVEGKDIKVPWKRWEQLQNPDITSCWGGYDPEVEFLKEWSNEIKQMMPCVPMWGMRVDR